MMVWIRLSFRPATRQASCLWSTHCRLAFSNRPRSNVLDESVWRMFHGCHGWGQRRYLLNKPPSVAEKIREIVRAYFQEADGNCTADLSGSKRHLEEREVRQIDVFVAVKIGLEKLIHRAVPVG